MSQLIAHDRKHARQITDATIVVVVEPRDQFSARSFYDLASFLPRTLPLLAAHADSDEAGHAFQSEAGRYAN